MGKERMGREDERERSEVGGEREGRMEEEAKEEREEGGESGEVGNEK